MFPAASTMPSPTPYAASPATKIGRTPAHTITGRAIATSVSPVRSTHALGRRRASTSATADPAPASNTIISNSPESIASDTSQRSWMSGSRVVRLMKTSPCAKNAAAAALRARRRAGGGVMP